jgi:dTDP-4-dehydrorhamnose reductase
LTAQGRTTWFGFTEAIMAPASINNKPKLKPIRAKDSPLPAKRPTKSVLSPQRLMDTFCGPPQWQKTLKLWQD